MMVVMPSTFIHTDHYFDSCRAEFVQGHNVIEVRNGLILGIENPEEMVLPNNAHEVDLRGLTVFPGFVDTHVHC
jgi:imidazolonepropionase-like amidohydrolase